MSSNMTYSDLFLVAYLPEVLLQRLSPQWSMPEVSNSFSAGATSASQLPLKGQM